MHSRSLRVLPLLGGIVFAISVTSTSVGQSRQLDCPGREDRQFATGQMTQAKDWADGLTCSRTSKCPQRRQCRKNVVIAHRRQYIAATVRCICPAPMTAKRARDFWKDFDDHTLRGVGRHIDDVYGTPGGHDKYINDLNAVMRVLSSCVDLEMKESHGLTPTDDEKKAHADQVKGEVSSGAVARLSKLQLDMIKEHFPNGNDIDFEDFQLATEMFANGELRLPGQLGEREMNQMSMWFYWKCFAIIAIDNDVDKLAWENILHSLEKGKEIYRTVYPAKPGSKEESPQGELTGSDASRFDPAKQLTDEQKEKLRAAIDGLSVDEVKKREKEELASMTIAKAEPCPRNESFANLQPQRQGNQTLLQITISVNDVKGASVKGTSVWLQAREAGFELPVGSYVKEMLIKSDEAGTFKASLPIPASVRSLTLSAVETQCLAFATASIKLPRAADRPAKSIQNPNLNKLEKK